MGRTAQLMPHHGKPDALRQPYTLEGFAVPTPHAWFDVGEVDVNPVLADSGLGFHQPAEEFGQLAGLRFRQFDATQLKEGAQLLRARELHLDWGFDGHHHILLGLAEFGGNHIGRRLQQVVLLSCVDGLAGCDLQVWHNCSLFYDAYRPTVKVISVPGT